MWVIVGDVVADVVDVVVVVAVADVVVVVAVAVVCSIKREGIIFFYYFSKIPTTGTE